MSDPVLLLRTLSTSTAPLEIEPGKTCCLTDLLKASVEPIDLKAPPYAICRMVRLANGDYRPVPVEWSEWVPLQNEWLQKLGIKISRQTLHRLWKNGYVIIRQTSPSIHELNLASFVAHLNRVHNNPHFWASQADDGSKLTRRAAYSKEIY